MEGSNKIRRINVSSAYAKHSVNSHNGNVDHSSFYFDFEDFWFLIDSSKCSTVKDLENELLRRIQQMNYPLQDILFDYKTFDQDSSCDANINEVFVETKQGLCFLYIPLYGQTKSTVEKYVLSNLKHTDQMGTIIIKGKEYYVTCSLHLSSSVIPSVESCDILQHGDSIQLQKVFILKSAADAFVSKFQLSLLTKQHQESNKSRGTIKRLSSSSKCHDTKRSKTDASLSEKSVDTLDAALNSMGGNDLKKPMQSNENSLVHCNGDVNTIKVNGIEEEKMQNEKIHNQSIKQKTKDSVHKKSCTSENVTSAQIKSVKKEEKNLFVNYLDTPHIQSLMKDKLAQFEKNPDEQLAQDRSLFDQQSDTSPERHSEKKIDTFDEVNTRPEKRKRNRRKNKKKKSEDDSKKVDNKDKGPPNYSLRLPQDQLPNNKRFIFNNSDEEEICDVKPILEPNNNNKIQKQQKLQQEMETKSLSSVDSYNTEKLKDVETVYTDKPAKPEFNNQSKCNSYQLKSPSSGENINKTDIYDVSHQSESSCSVKTLNTNKPAKPKVKERDFWKTDRRSIAGFLETMRNSSTEQKESPVPSVTQSDVSDKTSTPKTENKHNMLLNNNSVTGEKNRGEFKPYQKENKTVQKTSNNFRHRIVLNCPELSSDPLGACIDPSAKFAELMTKQRARKSFGRKDISDNKLETSQCGKHEERLELGETLTPLTYTPCVGEYIAFKVMEMDEAFCPGLSAFKVGKILNFIGDDISIELLPDYRSKTQKTGRFAMDWGDGNDDDNSILDTLFSMLHDVHNWTSDRLTNVK